MEKTIAQQLNIKEFPFRIKDKNGNRIYLEWDDSTWCRWEYDENGNKTYIEDNNGKWWKWRYDDNHKVTYYENDTGYWCKTEYNEDGNLIYEECSDDGVILDKRPKPTCEGKVVEIDGKKYKLTELKH